MSASSIIKKMFSFSPWDVFGILLGIVFIATNTKDDLFIFLTTPQLYIGLFMVFFLIHSLFWVFRYRGETLYLKGCIKHIFVDYFHVFLVFSCTIGSYFLSVHFFG